MAAIISTDVGAPMPIFGTNAGIPITIVGTNTGMPVIIVGSSDGIPIFVIGTAAGIPKCFIGTSVGGPLGAGNDGRPAYVSRVSRRTDLDPTEPHRLTHVIFEPLLAGGTGGLPVRGAQDLITNRDEVDTAASGTQ